MTLPTQKIQTLQLTIQSQNLEKELLGIKAEVVAEIKRAVEAHSRAVQRRGYSIKEIATMYGLSPNTVRSRIAEMQKDKKFARYISDFGAYKNGTYRQCLRIDIEGWLQYAQRKVV